MKDFVSEFVETMRGIDSDLKLNAGMMREEREARSTCNYLFRVSRRNCERQYLGGEMSLPVLQYVYKCLDVIRLHFIKRWGGRL